MRLVRAAAGVQAVLTLGVIGFLLVVVPSTTPPFDDLGLDQSPALVIMTVALSGLTAIALLLARRRPRHGLVPVLLLTSMVLVGQYGLHAWLLMAQRYGWPGAVLASWLTNWVWVFTAAGLVLLLLRFPTGDALSRRWRRYELVVLGHVGVLAAYFAVAPKLLGTPPDYPPNPLGVAAVAPWEPVFGVVFSLVGVHLLVGLAALVVRFRRGGPVERQQLRWVAVATAVLLAAVAANSELDAPTVVVSGGVAAFVVSIGVAALRYRLWDLGLVLRRALVYALLTGLLVAGYVGLVVALRGVITVELVPELIVTALTAVVALPLREVLQRAVDRMLFGDRRDPYAVIRALGQRLENGVEPTLPSVLSELADTLRLPGATVLLPDGSVAAQCGVVTVEGARIGLQHRGDHVGELVAARRHPGEPLTGVDLRLLTAVAGHLAQTVRAVALDEAVRRSQDRLVAAREAERTRLRHDLHDEMGPLLGAAALRLRAARNLLDATVPPLDRVGTVIDAAAGDVARALEEVQRIIADLRPGALRQHGLIDALREHAGAWAGNLRVLLDLPDLLPTLDPVVETAAYRIAVEGLHNAERHSGGTEARLRVAVLDGSLVLEVTDDGCGLSTPPDHGVGLGSMRERARLVGGSLRLEPSASGGLSVHSRLPVVAGAGPAG